MTLPTWTYNGQLITEIEDMPENTYGFIYEVFHKPSGKKYLGKKVLHFNRTLPPLKGMKRKRKVVKESDWRTYFGSHVEIKQLIKEEKQNEFERRILQFVPSKKLLTYYETAYLYKKDVLTNSEYLNDNIGGKFYRKDFDGYIQNNEP